MHKLCTTLTFLLTFLSSVQATKKTTCSPEHESTPLIEAIKKADIQEVTTLLQAGQSVNQVVDQQPISPLICATFNRNDNGQLLLRLILHYGADINYINSISKQRETALSSILVYNNLIHNPLFSYTIKPEYNYWREITTLILYGADFDFNPKFIEEALRDHITPLSLAVLLEQQKKVAKLLTASPALPWFKKLAQKLMHRSQTPEESLCNPPIDANILNGQDRLGLTPVHFAAARGLDTLVQQLLEAGADPNIKDRFGYTPLHYAAINGQTETLKILIASHADSTITNSNGHTALSLAQAITIQAHDTQRSTQTAGAIAVLTGVTDTL